MSEFFCCLHFQDLGDLEAYRAALKEINDYIARVEREVSTKLETTSRFQNPQEEYKISKVQFQLAAFFALVTANCKKREKVIIGKREFIISVVFAAVAVVDAKAPDGSGKRWRAQKLELIL